MEDKRAQVAAQCRAVAYLATVLAGVHSEYESVFHEGVKDDILELVGERTAAFMEQLGDMLNGMDAVDDEDEWLTPVFEQAQRLWPQVSTVDGYDHRITELEAQLAEKDLKIEELRDLYEANHG